MMALILDTETTALVSNRVLADDRLPEVIEFYAELVDLTNGQLSASMEQLIRPRHSIPDDIANITGINDTLVANSPVFKDVGRNIFTLIEATPLVIAHNCAFDKEVLDIEAGRLSPPYIIAWPRCVCSVEQTVHLTGKRLTLSKLHEHLFNERFADAHRAKADVKALTRCCVELYKRGEL